MADWQIEMWRQTQKQRSLDQLYAQRDALRCRIASAAASGLRVTALHLKLQRVNLDALALEVRQ
jgi:endonuclease/exonuclease/phosphatase family metal-dependent hydrolase